MFQREGKGRATLSPEGLDVECERTCQGQLQGLPPTEMGQAANETGLGAERENQELNFECTKFCLFVVVVLCWGLGSRASSVQSRVQAVLLSCTPSQMSLRF